jgi:large conductance mechanosensitive channel
MGMMQEFKSFAIKGNVFDLAVGVIVGGAFGKIVDSAVKDVIMPIVSKAVGNTDFSNMFIQLSSTPADYKGAMTYADLTKAGVNLFAYGNFITVVLNFLILAFIVFQMVRFYNKLKTAEPVAVVAPIPTSEDVLLLREIRDTLKKNKAE